MLELERKKRSKTEVVEEKGHLCLEVVDMFPAIPKSKKSVDLSPSEDAELETNFGFATNNPYCFILLHLRSKTAKNPLNLHIPQVCIFHDRAPLDIVYSMKGYIRGYRYSNAHIKLRLRDINKLFKDAWSAYSLPKAEPSVAAFAEKEMLMLSDNDLFLVCCKTKIDPFFSKLRYIQNKVSTGGNQPIKVPYPAPSSPVDLVKLATESLLGFKDEVQVRELLGEQQYLQFMNQKIALSLNYEHNIRLKSAVFSYLLAEDKNYYLINVEKLEFTNLTAAILEREKRLKLREEERNQILIMTPEKEARYKSYEDKEQVRTIERVMTGQFNSIVRKLNINTTSDNKREQVKNELAFKKLHPKSRFTYTQVITSEDFIKTKAEIFNLSKRKPMTIPSRRVMRFYNQVKPSRIKTESLEILTR